MKKLAIHGGLFLAACVTTYLHRGPYFMATLMGILTCHEFGHYVAGRIHRVPVSLPYFIPLPPQISLGTLGAVIKMDESIPNRNKLFDVGASGPIAGLVVAIPCLVVGLSLSEVAPMKPTDMIEGNSLLYAALKFAVFGRHLPADGVDVQLHPMAIAAWVGLLVTMINLMPIGQLDGGHIARSALGQAHETWSRRLHYILPVIGVITGGVMFGIASHEGRDVVDALDYARHGVTPWIIWTILLWALRRGGDYHPPVDDVPLTPLRKKLAVGMLIIFIAIATPVPWRPVL